MKKPYVAAAVLVLPLFLASGVLALSVNDQEGVPGAYYGGIFVGPSGLPDPTYAHDPVPPPSAGVASDQWRVDTLQASIIPNTGGFLQVVLTGQYFGTQFADPSSVVGVGRPGDLYISSTGWFVSTPSQDGHADGDIFSQTTEHWNYVIPFTATGPGTFLTNIYKFDQSLASYQGTSALGVSGAQPEFRQGQAWRGGENGLAAAGTGVVIFDPSGQTLTFKFPGVLVDGTVLDPEKIGYHWTQSCGNDVVEGGGTPVPEPVSSLLLGLGLAGLGVCRRKAAED